MYKVFCLKTKKTSKKSWKTYLGAYNNLNECSIVLTDEGIEWLKKHPEWIEERLKHSNNQ